MATSFPICRWTRPLAHHAASGNEVTLVLRSEGGPLHISLDPASGRVVDIADRLRLEGFPHYLFTGIYLVEPSFPAAHSRRGRKSP